ncbi:JAB domain-containing protein [Sorangium sp. So ce429]
MARFFEPMLAHLVHEELWMAALDAHHGVRGVCMLSRGGLSATVIQQSDVLRRTLEMAATRSCFATTVQAATPGPPTTTCS